MLRFVGPALLLGYLVGVAGAVFLLPEPIIEPLYAGIALASVAVGAGTLTLVLTMGNRAHLPWFGRAAMAPAEDGPAVAPVMEASSSAGPPMRLIAEAADECISAAELREILYEGRVEAWVRPVIGVPQARADFYHAMPRLRALRGESLEPCRYQSMAARCGLQGLIDQLLVTRCAQALRFDLAEGREVGIFCRVSPTSLNDDDFVAGVRTSLRDGPDLAGRLILELEQARLHRPARDALAALHEQGLRLCLRRLSLEGLDPATLAGHGFAFVRLERPEPVDSAREQEPDPHHMSLRRDFDRAGIGLVIDRGGTERLRLDLPDELVADEAPRASVA